MLFSLTALLIVAFMTSCEQENIDTPTNEIDRMEQLRSDPNYTTLIALNYQLINEVSNAMATQSITGEDLKNMYVNGQTDLLEAFFEGTQVTSIMDQIIPITNQLSDKYSDLIPASQGFDEDMLEGFNNLESIHLESRCSWQYGACVGAATAGLGGCLAISPWYTDHLCYAAYAAAVAQCINSFC